MRKNISSSLFVCVLLMVFAATPLHAAWQAGLMGGAVPGERNLTAYPATTNIYLSPHAAATQASPPWAGNTTWVYWGQIFLNGGTYHFAENIDDSTYLKIDGVQYINDDAWSQPTKSGPINLSAGWYTIEMRFGNGGGGAGPVDGNGWTSTKGFGYNIDGPDSTSGADYTFPVDDGAMSLFRYDDGTGFDTPTIATLGATNVTATTAWLNGSLVSTGATATAVIAYWGADDGGDDASAWANTNIWAAPQEIGEYSVQATALAADSAYYCRYSASNDAAVVWSDESATFITGELTFSKVSDGDEATRAPGIIRIARPTATISVPLTVYYEQTGGTAVTGVDFEPLLGSVVIPAGESYADIEIIPIINMAVDEDTTVAVSLSDGGYRRGTLSTATITIVNVAGITRPATFYVNPETGDNTRSVIEAIDPATPWKSIAYALSQAESNDIVQVSAGTCSPATGETFPLNIPAGVTLRGDGIFSTILSVNAAKTAVSMNAAYEAVLERLTITGVKEPGDGVHAISVIGGGSPLIRDVRLQGNENLRDNGFLMHINSSSPTFRNCLVAGNASGYMVRIGGISPAPVFENCTFFGNWNKNGFRRDAGTPTVRDCVFWRNRYDLNGLTSDNSVVSNCIVQSGAFNTTNSCTNADPGYFGGTFLPQTAAGQADDSIAVNAGSRTAAEAGLTGYTTRTDGAADEGVVNIGFHFPPGTVAGAEVYVSVSGDDMTGDGSIGAPWRTITKAIQNASYGSVVHVGAGLYRVGESFPLRVPDGVSVLGEDVMTTVISRNSGGAIVFLQNACWQRFENFTVQDARSADWACGIFIARSAPDVKNCVVRRNYGIWGGYGGIYCNSSLPRLSNLLVTANYCSTSSGGGGIGLMGCLAEINNATIVGNVCQRGQGEGIFASGIDVRTVVRDSVIWGNGVSDVTGLAADNLLNCLIGDGSFNGTNGCLKADPLLTRGYYLSSTATGGENDSPAIGAGSQTVADAGLVGWTTSIDGAPYQGAVSLGFHYPPGSTAGPALYVDIVNGDDSNDGLSPATALKTIKTALPMVRHGTVVNVAPGSYSRSAGDLPPFNIPDGVDLIGAGWTNTTIYANGANGSFQITGAVRSKVSGFTVRDATEGDYSGAFYLWASHLTIENCHLFNNIARRHGGGVHCDEGSSPIIRNCVIDLNSNRAGATTSGGGISVGAGRPVIESCTIVSNNVGRTNLGGGIALRSTTFTATIRNNVVRDNSSGDDLFGVTADMISHCHVGDGEFDGINKCFAEEPAFENLALRDYRLTSKSPAGLDAGIYQPWMEGATDLGGNPRVLNKLPDVGAFETWFPPPATIMLVR